MIPEEKFQKREWKALGLFDDGIFGSTTHLGTFGTMMREAAGWEKPWSRKEELEFIEQISRDFPCGGEAIAEADPDRADPYKGCKSGDIRDAKDASCLSESGA